MNLATGLKLTVLVLYGLGAAGCDASKPELDRTKKELKEVAAERDTLKSRLEESEGKISSLQQQLTSAQAAAKPAEEGEAKEAKKPAGKKSAKATKASKRKKR